MTVWEFLWRILTPVGMIAATLAGGMIVRGLRMPKDPEADVEGTDRAFTA